MKNSITLYVPAIIFFLLSCTSPSTSNLEIEVKRIEYQKEHAFIDISQPRFSWSFKSTDNTMFQSAYRILVASRRSDLENDAGTMWDSGKVNSDNSLNVTYDGKPLESFTIYYWKVRTWDQNGGSSGWSEINTFETAILNDTEWEAEWIGDGRPVPETDEAFYEKIPAPVFRKNFNINESVKSARLYISGLGYYESFLNGEKIGDHVLDPGWTNYGKEIPYVVYDVSGMIKSGDNAIGVILGNGWYNPLPLGLFRKFNLRKYLTIGQPKVIARLNITLENNKVITIETDDSWKTSESHILKNNVYLGEVQDGRQKSDEWKNPDFDDSGWNNVIIESNPGGSMRLQMIPPVKITERLEAVELTEPRPGIYVYDLGQNFAGWINLKVNEEPGTQIDLLYGEILNEDGTVNGMTTVAGHIKEIWNLSGGPGAPKTAFQNDQYIASGAENDFFQQQFTFHAFRYVQVKGLTKNPELSDLTGLRLSADLEDTGDFGSSNSMFGDVQDMVEWTFLSNVFSIQSDCPGREKLGYGGDIVVSAEAFIYNYDMTQFYRKTVYDFANDVRPNGGMPECAPYNGIDTKGFGEGTGPIGWQLAYPYVQKQLYTFYGDKRIIEENYDLTKGMVDFLSSQASDNLIFHGISDHVSVDPKPEALTSGAFYYHHVKLLSEFAEILGKADDKKNYEQLAETIRNSFNDKYLDTETGEYDTLTTQITQVFPLYYDLVPEELEERAFDVLLDEILEVHDGHLSTGIFGTKMLFDVLRLKNRNDVAYTIVDQRDYPGYGYMLEEGATTLWETWNKPDQNSWNHPMFGSVSEWYYRSVLGINPSDDAVGFDKIYIRPYIFDDLDFAEGNYHSIRGKIQVSWEKEETNLNMEVSVPPNIIAWIHIPANTAESVVFNDKNVDEVEGIEYIEFKDNYAIYKVGNGSFTIKSKI